jgi:hypothetical protein
MSTAALGVRLFHFLAVVAFAPFIVLTSGTSSLAQVYTCAECIAYYTNTCMEYHGYSRTDYKALNICQRIAIRQCSHLCR